MAQQNSIQCTLLNMKEDTKTIRSAQLEIDNAYLKQQNEHLAKELSFTRYTINALKNISNQKDASLNETRQELERALQHIQLLAFTVRQQQRLSGIDADSFSSGSSSSSDDQSSIEEEELVSSRPAMVDIMSKLPLRRAQPAINNEIFIQHQDY